MIFLCFDIVIGSVYATKHGYEFYTVIKVLL